jgi:outer membrane receptor protein involved in Fe transport
MKLSRVLPAICIALSLLSAAPFASAQTTTGSIAGRVTDSVGAIIPGADVTITNVDKGLETRLTTNGAGEYTALALPPGQYTVTASKAGFNTESVRAFKLDLDQKARVDVSLGAGKVSQTITVSATAPVLQTQGAETGAVISTREILDLPLLGRDYEDLFLLSPGVSTGGGYGTQNYSISGQRELGNDVELNGIDIQGNRNNDNSLKPSVDALQEFKIVTSTYAPELGRASGGVVLLETKAGTNNFHGNAYEFFRPNNTSANTAITPAGVEPVLKQHNFGGTVGGPILRDKAFFFLSYEGLREVNQYSYLTIVPPSSQIVYDANGDVDLSGLTDPYTGMQDPIFDPFFFENNYYAEQFPGNVIPSYDVSPAGKMILQQLFPKQQNNSFFTNYNVLQHFTDKQNVGNVRFDYTFSQKDRAYLTYDVEQISTLTGDPFAGNIPIAGGGGADSGNYEYIESQTVGLIYDHTFSPNLLNEVHGSYYMTPYHQNSLVDGSNLATKFGIMNANIPGFPQTYGFPQIQFESGDTTGGSTFEPLDFRDHNLQFVEQLSWIHHNNNFKFGYEYRLLQSTPDFSLFPVPYEYFGGPYSAFTSDPTYTYYNPNAYYATGGSEVADLLLGLPYVVDQGLQLTVAHTESNEHTFYVQDYWQATPHLNITYGIRYEYQQPYVEKNNNAANFDPGTLSMLLAGRGTNSRSLVNSDKNNFAPRVGFAYEVNPKTSVRGGFGIFFSPENDAKEDLLTKNYPFFIQQQFVNSPYYFSYFLDSGIARPTSVSIPAGATSVSLTTGSTANQTVYYEQPNLPNGYSENFNLTVQRMLTSQTSLEVGYVGAVSHKLSYAIGNLNYLGAISKEIGQVNALTSAGLGNYNSLQASLKRQVSNGLSLRLSYTYAKTMDNGPGPFNIGAGTYPANPYNLNAEYADANYDRRHNFVGAGVYELPVGRGKWLLSNANGVTQFFLGGWTFSTIATLRTGNPVNIVFPTPAGSGITPRPYLVPGQNPNAGPKTPIKWFNTAAFSRTPVFPNEPIISRNIVRGPGYTDADLSLLKNFPLPREMTFQLRIESFNTLNIAHYSQPGGTISTGTFGAITSGYTPRVMQFAGKINF